MAEDNIAIRLKGFIQSQGLTYAQFADNCGIARPSLSQLLGGRNKKISDVMVGQIHRAYPQLSVLWLMFGEGKMIDDGDAQSIPRVEVEKMHADVTDEIGQKSIFEIDDPEITEEFTYAPQFEDKYENVKPLIRPKKRVNASENERNEGDVQAVELLRQIEKMKKNPRKVTQITVYYDDSTFETFCPKK